MTSEDRAQIVEELKPALVRASNGRAKVDQIDESALIIEDVGLASLDLLELRFELEERWKTRITDEEAIRLKRIHDVVDLIVERTQTRARLIGDGRPDPLEVHATSQQTAITPAAAAFTSYCICSQYTRASRVVQDQFLASIE